MLRTDRRGRKPVHEDWSIDDKTSRYLFVVQQRHHELIRRHGDDSGLGRRRSAVHSSVQFGACAASQPVSSLLLLARLHLLRASAGSGLGCLVVLVGRVLVAATRARRTPETPGSARITLL